VIIAALAFITGMVLLLIANEASAGTRMSIDTTVFSGMVLASFIGVLFVPALFAFFEITTERAGRSFTVIGGHQTRQSTLSQ